MSKRCVRARQLAHVAQPGRLRRTAGDAAADVSGLLVDGTRSSPDNLELGWGIQVADETTLTLHSSRLSGNRGSGLRVTGAGASASVVGLLVDGTLPEESDDRFGRGVVVADAAKLTLTSARMSGNRACGLGPWPRRRPSPGCWPTARCEPLPGHRRPADFERASAFRAALAAKANRPPKRGKVSGRRGRGASRGRYRRQHLRRDGG